jgi:hypothetical protein
MKGVRENSKYIRAGVMREQPYIQTLNNVTSGGTQNCEKAAPFWWLTVERK